MIVSKYRGFLIESFKDKHFKETFIVTSVTHDESGYLISCDTIYEKMSVRDSVNKAKKDIDSNYDEYIELVKEH